MHRNLVIVIKALIVTIALIVLLYQLTLLAQCLRLSELPLQNAAGTLSVIAFASLASITISYRPESTHSDATSHSSKMSFKPTSRIQKYYAPLLEILIITTLVNLSCIFWNSDDVIEPYALSLVRVEASQAILFGTAVVLAWKFGRKRDQKQVGGEATSGKDTISDNTSGTIVSLKELALNTPHSTYAPTY